MDSVHQMTVAAVGDREGKWTLQLRQGTSGVQLTDPYPSKEKLLEAVGAVMRAILRQGEPEVTRVSGPA